MAGAKFTFPKEFHFDKSYVNHKLEEFTSVQ